MAMANIGGRWRGGILEFFNRKSGLKIGALTADGLEMPHKGAIAGTLVLSKAADYALAGDEKNNFAFDVTLTGASKTVTLGLPAGQVAIINNAGSTNAFTLKNVAGDTGTSVAAGKAVLVIAATTANATRVIALN